MILQYFGCKMIILCNVYCFTANHVHDFLVALKSPISYGLCNYVNERSTVFDML